MALTTTQVNQAFLGLLGRPATGAEAAKFAGQLDAATLAQTLLTDASFKTQLSLEAPSFKTVDLLNTDPAAFVESLYTALLGRASDAEGKAFWLSVAGATPNRADVVSQFIAAVQSQEGSADANAFATIQAEDKALASAWVESLYNNLAGRASDAEGLDFWTNAIVSFTMTPAQVAASFAAALALQGNTTEDGQNYLAKQGVADNFTANFKDFGTLITANEKTKVLNNLVTMMNGVNKDSQVDQYVEEITKVGNEYQNIAAVQFTKADDDDLGIDPETGESNLTTAANFTGTINITDETLGTIQQGDSATGNANYFTNTLTVNVTGYDKDIKNNLNLDNALPSTTDVQKLVINNGAAGVDGSVSGFDYLAINGTGDVDVSGDNMKDVSINSASTANVGFTATSVETYKGGAGKDIVGDNLTQITVSKSINTGAGDDEVNADLADKATADLGAGDDTFTGSLGKDASLNAGAGDDVVTLTSVALKTDKKENNVPSVTVDLGTGDDKLDLSTSASTDFTGIKSIKGTETIKIQSGTTLNATAISGQKIALDSKALNDELVLKAGTENVDLSKLSLADGAQVDIRIEGAKGNVTLAKTDKNATSTIKETVVISSDSKNTKITGFEVAADKIEIQGALVDAGTQEVQEIATIARDTIYKTTDRTSISANTLAKAVTEGGYGLTEAKLNSLKNGDVFYIAQSPENSAGSSTLTKVFKVTVGQAGKIKKVDQITTISTKDIDFKENFQNSQDYAEKYYLSEVPANKFNMTDIGNAVVLSVDDADYAVNALNVSGGTATQTLEVNTTKSNVPLTITVEDNLKSITTGAGNETVKASGAALDNIAEIDLGAGTDTIVLSGDATAITSLKNVEVIDLGGQDSNLTLSVLEENLSTVDSLILSSASTKILTLDASGDASIDLSKLVADETNASGTITLSNVGAGTTSGATITLNATDAIAETITLASGAEKVAISGIANTTIATEQDKLNISAINSASSITAASSTGLVFNQINFLNVSKAIDTAELAFSELSAASISNFATSGNSKAIVAFNYGEKSYIYVAQNNSTGKDITVGELKLIATVDNKIDNSDSVSNGVITFA